MNKFLIALLLILSSCASIKRMRGTEAEAIKGARGPEVKLSALYAKELSQEGYHVVHVYFLNESDRWQRIKTVEVVELPGISDFHVIGGNDLESWKKSMLLDYELKVEAAKKARTPAPDPRIKAALEKLTIDSSLTEPAGLPGKFQTERWVLLQTPGQTRVGEVIIKVSYIDSSVVSYRLQLAGLVK